MNKLKKIICLFKGHTYNEDILKVYNTRFCARCKTIPEKKTPCPFVTGRNI